MNNKWRGLIKSFRNKHSVSVSKALLMCFFLVIGRNIWIRDLTKEKADLPF